MKLTGDAAHLPSHPVLSQEDQEAVILRVAAQVGVPATFLAAVRIAEGGGLGREFGVLSENAPDYLTQALITASSIRNNQYRYVKAHDGQWPTTPAGELSMEFIEFMASRWAPSGAENDPTGLNKNWAGNVDHAYRNSGLA